MAIRIMDSIKTANDTTDFPVSYAKDVWLNKDKNGATENYSDLQTMYNNDLLGSGGSSIQVNTMPIASVDELGKIYEFIGSTGTYVNGYFYECVSDGEPTPKYSWVQKNVQPNAESFTFNSDEFAVDSATNEVSLKPSYADIPSFLPNNVSSSNKLATNSSITAITDLIPSNASATNKLVTKNDLADKQDFRIFNSLEEFNEKKGTSLTVVSGIDNMKDIANAMSNGEILIIIVRYELGSEIYFGLTTSTGWTKMFTFIKSNELCDVECRTTFPLTLKRLLNSDGVVGDWQQLVTKEVMRYSVASDLETALTNLPLMSQLDFTVNENITVYGADFPRYTSWHIYKDTPGTAAFGGVGYSYAFCKTYSLFGSLDHDGTISLKITALVDSRNSEKILTINRHENNGIQVDFDVNTNEIRIYYEENGTVTKIVKFKSDTVV